MDFSVQEISFTMCFFLTRAETSGEKSSLNELFTFNSFVFLCATSCLTAGEGAGGQSAGGSIAITLTADIPHFA